MIQNQKTFPKIIKIAKTKSKLSYVCAHTMRCGRCHGKNRVSYVLMEGRCQSCGKDVFFEQPPKRNKKGGKGGNGSGGGGNNNGNRNHNTKNCIRIGISNSSANGDSHGNSNSTTIVNNNNDKDGRNDSWTTGQATWRHD